MNYLAALRLVHDILQPSNYCEIGCRRGHSLSLSRAPAIGVDPDFVIGVSLFAPTRLFKMTSDGFFAQPDVKSILAAPIDLAFIDGMHQVEFALRDFINLEKHADLGGVILIDDVLPERMEYASRERHSQIWTGDVYRVILVLKHYRPDLDIRIHDIEMKGLAVVSALNPASTVLADNYSRIEAELSSGMWRVETIEALREKSSPKPAETLEVDLRTLAAKRQKAAAQAASQPARSTHAADSEPLPATRNGRSRPKLSVIICAYNMPREAPRTILSSALPYQKGVADTDFEVIVVDNGSDRHFPRDDLPAGVKVVDMPSARPSPVFAMNWAAREIAQGDILAFAIDGARIFTDRLISEFLRASAAFDDAFVYTLAWHLGPKVQMQSVKEGYNQETEDRLIAQSGWPRDPNGLFSVSVFAGSSASGFFSNISESNAFSISRQLFEQFGGYDERFTSPGAGLANLEIFARYVTRPNARNICLLSEGTFHQVHGGIATNGVGKQVDFASEYQRIFGKSYARPNYDFVHFGTPRPAMLNFFKRSIGYEEPALD